MPAGTGVAEPTQDYPSGGAPRLHVVLMDPDLGFVLLPNVEPLDEQYRDDLTPPQAQYQFVFDSAADPSFPRTWYEVFGDGQGIPLHSVKNDDRILLFEELDDGTLILLHDGFAQVPQADVDGELETVQFTVVGTPVRCDDFPLPGRVERDGTDPGHFPSSYEDDDSIQTQLEIRFNPQGRPNMSTVSYEGKRSHRLFRNFVDPLIDNRTPDVRDWWTVAEAAIYVMETGNVDIDGNPDPYVQLPDFDEVRDLLTDLKPTTAGTPVDPNDPDTFTREPILCHELDVSGDRWRAALLKIIAPYDFGARWVLEYNEESLEPIWRLELYRRDVARHTRWFHHPAVGSRLDVTTFDQTRFTLQAGTDEVVNGYDVLTDPDELEVTVVLEAMFQPNPQDLDPDNQQKFSTKGGRIVGAEYRLWGAGEAGDPFWSFPDGDWKISPLDLRDVFQPDDDETAPRRYVRRRRPALGREILSKGGDVVEKGQAVVEISTDYAGPSPALWSSDPDFAGAGSHWRTVGSGCWKLSDKMLGIELTDDDPWDVNIGKVPLATVTEFTPFPSGKIDVMRCMAQPDTGANATNPRFWFRLTLRFSADRGIQASAPRRPFSPTKFRVVDHDDCRDRFRRQIIDPSSINVPRPSGGQAPVPEVVRDDTKSAQAHVEARRKATEALRIAGSVTIPYLAHAFSPGDQVIGFAGVDVELNNMDGGQQGEPPRYPVVVGRTWSFSGAFSTTLLLGDYRAQPAFRPNFTLAATAKEARKPRQKIDNAADLARGQAFVNSLMPNLPGQNFNPDPAKPIGPDSRMPGQIYPGFGPGAEQGAAAAAIGATAGGSTPRPIQPRSEP